MNETNNKIKKEIFNKVKGYGTIIIHRHGNPDPDALGSQGGLQKILQQNFPEKNIYVVGEEVEGLQFLNRMDVVENTVYEGALVIAIDTANTDRISDDRFSLGKELIKIDHHPNREPFGDLQWVDTSYSSASEMIADWVQFLNETGENVRLSNEAARLLYAGIIGDTGRFLYDNTTSRTHALVSTLVTYDFSPNEIFGTLYQTDKQTARLHGYILQHFDVTKKGVASMFLSEELLNEFGVSKSNAANLVNVLANIEGNQIWVFFVDYGDEIRVRIRSKEKTINEVAHQFGGGGHPKASGATVSSLEEGQQLIETLDQLL